MHVHVGVNGEVTVGVDVGVVGVLEHVHCWAAMTFVRDMTWMS